ncbi:MAG TPA: hypothetical protein VJN68_13615 [Burkholderiaceae bacterium]|nr:hypothetical protein [Burkholderiaceae bacterium]
MQLHFAPTESALAYFVATQAYLDIERARSRVGIAGGTTRARCRRSPFSIHAGRIDRRIN